MHPVLIELGPLTLHTYGVFVAAAFFVAILWSLRRAGQEGIDPERMLDLAFYVTLSAIIGARVLFIVVEYRYFLEHPLRVFKIWEGGLVFYGGLILALVTAIAYLRKHAMPVLKVGDIIAPALSLAQAIGRFGCLWAGCCYGKETHVPWGIVFRDPGSLVPLEKLGVTLHPTQLYSSLGNFLLFLILYGVGRKKRFDGQVMLLYGILYPLLRAAIEFFRGDPRGALMGGMISTSQTISVAVCVVSVYYYLRVGRTARSVS